MMGGKWVNDADSSGWSWYRLRHYIIWGNLQDTNYSWHHVSLQVSGKKRTSEICLLLTHFLCKHIKNTSKQETVLYCCRCTRAYSTAPSIARTKCFRSGCSRNIYWHSWVHGLTFQTLFAVFKCQSTLLPQRPLMPFLKSIFWSFRLSLLKLCQTKKNKKGLNLHPRCSLFFSILWVIYALTCLPGVTACK